MLSPLIRVEREAFRTTTTTTKTREKIQFYQTINIEMCEKLTTHGSTKEQIN